MVEENQQHASAPEQQFSIQKIYIKDVSFESPNAPGVFADGEWKPEINLQINTAHNSVGNNAYEVNLKITVTAKQGKKTAFLVEITQSGVFGINGFSQDQLAGMLGAFCPETLFPFARESISDLVVKGGFPQLLLAPVNFNAIYAQHVQQQQAADATQDTAH